MDAFGSDTAGYYASKGDAARIAGDRARARAYFEGAQRKLDLAGIYAALGDRDGAIEQLRALLEIPSWVSPGDLRVNPDWALLRDDPRFQQLANQSLPADSR